MLEQKGTTGWSAVSAIALCRCQRRHHVRTRLVGLVLRCLVHSLTPCSWSQCVSQSSSRRLNDWRTSTTSSTSTHSSTSASQGSSSTSSDCSCSLDTVTHTTWNWWSRILPQSSNHKVRVSTDGPTLTADTWWSVGPGLMVYHLTSWTYGDHSNSPVYFR